MPSFQVMEPNDQPQECIRSTDLWFQRNANHSTSDIGIPNDESLVCQAKLPAHAAPNATVERLCWEHRGAVYEASDYEGRAVAIMPPR